MAAHTGNHIEVFSRVCTIDALPTCISELTEEAHTFLHGYAANTSTTISQSTVCSQLNGGLVLFAISIIIFNGTSA